MMRALSLLLWIPVGASLVACAGDETTGGFVEFTGTLPFSPEATSYTQELDVAAEPEIAAIAGQVVCGGLDLALSRLSVDGIEGVGETPFTLRATLIDPQAGEELDYFEWAGTLSSSTRQVSFGSEATSLREEALTRLREIVGERADKRFEVRYQLDADPMPSLVKVTVVQHLRVATEAGTCP